MISPSKWFHVEIALEIVYSLIFVGRSSERERGRVVKRMSDAAAILRLRSTPTIALTNSAKTRARNKLLIEQTAKEVSALRRKTELITRLWRDNAAIERGDLISARERRRIKEQAEVRHVDGYRQVQELLTHSHAELTEISRLCETTQAAIHRYEQLCDEAVAEWEQLDAKLESIGKAQAEAAPRLRHLMEDVQLQSQSMESEMARLDALIAAVEAENDALRYRIAEEYEREVF